MILSFHRLGASAFYVVVMYAVLIPWIEFHHRVFILVLDLVARDKHLSGTKRKE